jgi:rubredoxin
MITRCSKHPKYMGKRQPKYECLGCLNLYAKMHTSPRSPHKPTKTFKTIKNYSRKSRHKGKEV